MNLVVACLLCHWLNYHEQMFRKMVPYIVWAWTISIIAVLRLRWHSTLSIAGLTDLPTQFCERRLGYHRFWFVAWKPRITLAMETLHMCFVIPNSIAKTRIYKAEFANKILMLIFGVFTV